MTISGGEPLLQPEFVSGVFKAVQEMGLNTGVRDGLILRS